MEFEHADEPGPLVVAQVLPALNAGGVERGTVEFARELVRRGHRAVVISSGGRQLEALQRAGAEHIEMPVHRKSLRSLFLVPEMRRLLADLQPDIVHVRSRMPAWIVWLAWRGMTPGLRPGLVSTFHGLYSVNAYSAVMGRAEEVIAISECVERYIRANYRVDPARITLIHRGLDPAAFRAGRVDSGWREALFRDFPAMRDRKIVLMPGRLTRWKGQEDFLKMMAQLVELRPDCHGVVIGGAEADKRHYQEELLALRAALGLTQQVSFVGHRGDIAAFYELAAVTCHMSNKAEPFGRTVPESLALGTPVVAYARGGASESLNAAFPRGLVEADNIPAFAQRVAELLGGAQAIELPREFYLASQVDRTLAVYRRLLARRAATPIDTMVGER